MLRTIRYQSASRSLEKGVTVLRADLQRGSQTLGDSPGRAAFVSFKLDDRDLGAANLARQLGLCQVEGFASAPQPHT